MLVLLDSSMLMLPLEKKINLSFELERILLVAFEIVVPQIVLMELGELKIKGEMSTKRKAELALNLAKSFRTIESKTEGHVDHELIRLAEIHKAIVATNDRKLRSILIDKGKSVISLHGKNKLAIFGDLSYQ
ncbi:MAG: type II toxin-antitoxin system VapC family toxin [Candidatus Heimdallarchaeaceae archaeon]